VIDPIEELARVVRESGLVADGSKGVALVSGGPDSACLAAGLAAVCGPSRLSVVHVNYGLRPDSDEDEDTCAELGRRLGIELRVEHPDVPEGNVQAAARELRYAAAERLRERSGATWIATGHTRTDVAETVLYRLATSPGRRALLGLAPRRGAIVRPLLALGRGDTRRLATEAGLPFRDDPTNADPGFARNRIRSEVLPVLREMGPAEANIAETRVELAEEAELLEGLAVEALDAIAADTTVVRAADLSDMHVALRRLVLRALAARAAGRAVPLGRESAARIWRLAQDPEGGTVELGGGLDAICEQGWIRFASGSEPEPAATALPVPGSCRFGSWELRAEIRLGPLVRSGPELATLDPEELSDPLEVRAWRPGDRIRPMGMTGSKTLQDLFTDAKVPRSLRHALPLVVSGGRIAWVAGVAVSEEFRLPEGAPEAAVVTVHWRP
jgi:tRNA(Ile)-lysidine synthase